MPFEVTHKDLSKPAFRTGLAKVLNAPSKDHKVVYNLGRMGDLIDQHIRNAQRDLKKLAKNHEVLNEQGIIEPSAEENDAWVKAHEEFLSHKVKVERHKIRLDDIKDVALTPLEISALEPVLDDVKNLH